MKLVALVALLSPRRHVLHAKAPRKPERPPDAPIDNEWQNLPTPTEEEIWEHEGEINDYIRNTSEEDLDYSDGPGAYGFPPVPDHIRKEMNETQTDIHWRGDFDGRDEPLKAPWRVEAEALMNQAANGIGMDISDIMWDYHKLKVVVEGSSDDISRLTVALKRALEPVDPRLRILDRHLLEVTTPGTSDVLTMQREFEAFKGFNVIVTTQSPIPDDKGRVVNGKLVEKNAVNLVLNQKGRMVKIPYWLVTEVRLPKPGEETSQPKELSIVDLIKEYED